MRLDICTARMRIAPGAETALALCVYSDFRRRWQQVVAIYTHRIRRCRANA